MILTPAQKLIAKDRHRFRVLRCGRRFGKTTLAVEEMIGKAMAKNSNQIFYIAPTFQQARDIVWEYLLKRLQGILINKNEQRLETKVKTAQGGIAKIILRSWEAIETIRGQRVDFFVGDEIREMRNWKYGWQQVVRPALTDTKGHGLFISTPNGYDHFYELTNEEINDSDYKSFHYTTYDNPHIPIEEIEKARRELTEDAFAQEYLAEFRKKTGIIYREFDRDIHVIDAFEIPREWQIIRCMDFGAVHPTVCLWLGISGDDTIYIFDEYFNSAQTAKFHAALIQAKSLNLPIQMTWRDPSANQAGLDYAECGIITTPAPRVFTGEQDWVNAGIDKIRQLLKVDSQTGRSKIYIFRNCINTIREFETYTWAMKKADNIFKDMPYKVNDDCMDALRYGIEGYLSQGVVAEWGDEEIQIPTNPYTGY